MEGGRYQGLIRQLAFDGVVDFSQARVFDRQWWRYLRRRVTDLARRQDQEVRKAESAYYAVRALTASADKAFDWLERMREATLDVVDYYRPDLTKDRRKAPKTDAEKNLDLREKWVREFGNPDDPEVQEAIERTVRMLSMDEPPPPVGPWS